jgi:chromate transporter
VETLRLILTLIKVGAISFGGGWSVVGIMRNEIVGGGWLSADAFADIVAIAQVTPGPVAVNCATMVGYQSAGIFGSIVATLSVLSVPFLVSALAGWYLGREPSRVTVFAENIAPVTIAMIAATLIGLFFSPSVDVVSISLAVVAFAASAFTKTEPLLIIFGAGGIGLTAAIFGH